MNLFKTLWSKAKDALKESSRESSLKAQYRTYIAKKEEEIVGYENAINSRITNESYAFSGICEVFQDLEAAKEELNLAKKTYEYIFTEEDKKK